MQCWGHAVLGRIAFTHFREPSYFDHNLAPHCPRIKATSWVIIATMIATMGLSIWKYLNNPFRGFSVFAFGITTKKITIRTTVKAIATIPMIVSADCEEENMPIVVARISTLTEMIVPEIIRNL